VDLYPAGVTSATDESGLLSVHSAGIAVPISLITLIKDLVQQIGDAQSTIANYTAMEQSSHPELQVRHLLHAKGRLLYRCSIHFAGTASIWSYA
jgi:hypothetical protein